MFLLSSLTFKKIIFRDQICFSFCSKFMFPKGIFLHELATLITVVSQTELPHNEYFTPGNLRNRLLLLIDLQLYLSGSPSEDHHTKIKSQWTSCPPTKRISILKILVRCYCNNDFSETAASSLIKYMQKRPPSIMNRNRRQTDIHKHA